MLLSLHAADPFLTYEEMRERMRPLLGDNGVHLSPFLSRRSLLRGPDTGQSPAGTDSLSVLQYRLVLWRLAASVTSAQGLDFSAAWAPLADLCLRAVPGCL